MTIRVIVVDDHPLMLAGVVARLSVEPDIDVVATAATCAATVVAVGEDQPDVLIADVSMPDGSLINALGDVVAAMEEHVRFVWLEDVRAEVGTADKLRGLLGAGRAHARPAPGAPAAVLFTSGSEGAPKGVVLSHSNILSNIAQVGARIDFGPGDIVFNVLPVFHSFGLTVGTILPLCAGVPVFMYPTPLHYRIIPELVYQTNATILFGTDTFLAGYARSAHPYDLRSVRYVLAGAEPVKDSTRRTYAEKFGLRILEGYGVTETAPVLDWYRNNGDRVVVVNAIGAVEDITKRAISGLRQ